MTREVIDLQKNKNKNKRGSHPLKCVSLVPPSDICEKWLNSVLTFLLGKLPLNLCPRFGHKLFKKIIGHFVLNRVDFRIPNT